MPRLVFAQLVAICAIRPRIWLYSEARWIRWTLEREVSSQNPSRIHGLEDPIHLRHLLSTAVLVTAAAAPSLLALSLAPALSNSVNTIRSDRRAISIKGEKGGLDYGVKAQGRQVAVMERQPPAGFGGTPL